MATLRQAILQSLKTRKQRAKHPRLLGRPQRAGVVMRLRICTPRKPNSARRPVAVVLIKPKKYLFAHLPGIGHTIRRHSKVLVQGRGARDLPYVNYSCIRGVYDFLPLYERIRRRSIYGVKRDPTTVTFIRRKFRTV